MEPYKLLDEAAQGLTILTHAYDHVTETTTGADQFAAQREIIRAKTAWAASVANIFCGKVPLPHPDWKLTINDFERQSRHSFIAPILSNDDMTHTILTPLSHD